MNIQAGFLFDAPLTEIPASQLPTPVKKEAAPADLLRLSANELIARVQEIAPTLDDDIAYFDALLAIGFPQHAITSWHSSRMLDGLLPPNGDFQAYKPEDGGQIRFRLLPPLMPCPGFEDIPCTRTTRGGARCLQCAAIETEDLWNQE